MSETTSDIKPLLAPDYYVHNFLCVLDQVMARYDDLLSPQENRLCRTFRDLTQDAQRLYVRLLTRKGELFRPSKLVYAEISQPSNAQNVLTHEGWIDTNPTLRFAQLLPLWSKAEWLERLTMLELPVTGLSSMKRTLFDVALGERLGHSAESVLKANEIASITGEVPLQLLHPQLFDVLKLLFFGNPYQDLTEFVLRDLGLYRYEQYSLDRQYRFFQSRDQIEQHLACYALGQHVPEVLEAGPDAIREFASLLPPSPSDDPILARRLNRMRYTLARQLERYGELDAALALYQLDRCPLDRHQVTLHQPAPSQSASSQPTSTQAVAAVEKVHHPMYEDALERQIRLLAKIGDVETALALCRTHLDDAEHSQHFPWRFGSRLAKQLGRDWPKRAPAKPRTETLELAPHDSSVEWAALDHFQAFGPCYYVENALFNTVFGLHYWEVMFASVPGAFSHPFQHAPHDLYQPEFAHLRADLLRAQHTRIPHIPERIDHYIELWQQKFGCLNPCVYWQGVDEEVLRLALQRIPVAHWQAIFCHLWRDLKQHSSGLPDLIHFPQEGGYELIEVKGPGDRLQHNQLAWMEYFALHAIPHRVVHVTWRTD